MHIVIRTCLYCGYQTFKATSPYISLAMLILVGQLTQLVETRDVKEMFKCPIDLYLKTDGVEKNYCPVTSAITKTDISYVNGKSDSNVTSFTRFFSCLLPFIVR